MKTTTLHNKAELLAEIAQGNEKSFATLFHFYRNTIYSVAYRLTKSTFLAEEVVQDIFLKLWLKRSTIAEIDDLEAYLFILARNQVFSALKQLARQKTMIEELEAEVAPMVNSTYDNIFYQEHEQVIREAINQLPAQQKQVYLMSREQELKRDEIAGILQISSETVKTHLARAIRYIRAYSQSQLGIHTLFLFFSFTN